MVHASLVEELAVAPSSSWAALIQRHNLVRDYLQILRPTKGDISAFANRAGVSQRMFYRLVKRHRDHLQGSSKPTKITGRGAPICRDQEAVIADAIRLSGPGATTKEVVDAVRHISADLGLRLPSEFAIIDRIRCGSDLAGLNERLQCAFEWVVDACATDLEIECWAGETKTAWIVGLIDLARGTIEHHLLCVGVPGAADLHEIIGERWCGITAVRAGAGPLAVTPIICKQIAGAISSLSDGVAKIAPCPRNTIRSGEALRSIFGQKLGGIRLRSRRGVVAEDNRPAGVPEDIARAVVDELIDTWNRKATTRFTTATLSTPASSTAGRNRSLCSHPLAG